jgi:hypothetical protein
MSLTEYRSLGGVKDSSIRDCKGYRSIPVSRHMLKAHKNKNAHATSKKHPTCSLKKQTVRCVQEHLFPKDRTSRVVRIVVFYTTAE